MNIFDSLSLFSLLQSQDLAECEWVPSGLFPTPTSQEVQRTDDLGNQFFRNLHLQLK